MRKYVDRCILRKWENMLNKQYVFRTGQSLGMCSEQPRWLVVIQDVSQWDRLTLDQVTSYSTSEWLLTNWPTDHLQVEGGFFICINAPEHDLIRVVSEEPGLHVCELEDGDLTNKKLYIVDQSEASLTWPEVAGRQLSTRLMPNSILFRGGYFARKLNDGYIIRHFLPDEANFYRCR